MESINQSMHESMNEPLEDGYFYCPVCGEKDLVFFDEVLIQKINKEKYNNLTEEQRLYINEKLEYGVLLCEHCYKKEKRRVLITKCFYGVVLILLYTLPVVAICSLLIFEVLKRFKKRQRIVFDNAWKCDAVRRLCS